jgi:hypothetical protein
MPIPLQQMDDFHLTNLPSWDYMKWEDISVKLQKLLARHIFGLMEPDKETGDHAKWEVQYDYDDNFAVTGPHDTDDSSTKSVMTTAEVFWSYFKTNYIYDLRQVYFNGDEVAILKWLDRKEHELMTSFWIGMEKQLAGPGPSAPSPPVERPPLCSLLWYLPPYNVAGGNQSSIGTLASGVTSDFLGCDPPGFASVGTAGISRVLQPGWRHRVGTYNVFNEDDALDTILDCMDLCQFTPVASYSELAPTEDPDWMLITTRSRLKLARRISASQNDNMKGNVTKWKDTVFIRGVPLEWWAAWTSNSIGCQQTNGPVMGINKKTWSYCTNAAVNLYKSPPIADPNNKVFGRWRCLDHSCQLKLRNPRGNFIVTYGGAGTIVEAN